MKIKTDTITLINTFKCTANTIYFKVLVCYTIHKTLSKTYITICICCCMFVYIQVNF